MVAGFVLSGLNNNKEYAVDFISILSSIWLGRFVPKELAAFMVIGTGPVNPRSLHSTRTSNSMPDSSPPMMLSSRLVLIVIDPGISYPLPASSSAVPDGT